MKFGDEFAAPIDPYRRGDTARWVGTGGWAMDGRRLSSCGIWRGESGGPEWRVMLLKYGCRPERRDS